jgi:hypothetical protein
MIKNNLTDIDEINFSVDGLSYSYKHEEWTAATDSSIEVIGLNMEKHTIQSGKRAGKEIELPVRALIGFQC